MKLSKKIRSIILIILLIISSVLLLITKSQKDVLQERIDLVFTDAISDSMGGLNKDYSKLNLDEKSQLYYQTMSNLHDALEVFHATSYRKYDDMFLVLNKLYIHLLTNKDTSYEIKHKLYIFEFLGKILVFPEDIKLITDFNNFLDGKDAQ